MPDEMPTPNAPGSRRRFLRLAGAATAGVAATSLAAPEHAAAATGASMLIGHFNSPSDADDTTSLVNPSATILMAATLRVANYSSGAYIPPTGHRTAVLGYTTGTDARGGYRIGVHGRAENPTIPGATGVSNLNYNAGNATPAIANSFTCGLTAGGAMTVMCAQQAAHVIVDISGFIY